MKSTYKISKKEIDRRIKAYTTLIASFFISIIILSFNYIVLYFNIFIYIILFLALILFYSRIIVIRYFNTLSNTKVVLTKSNIIKNDTKYLIKDIKKVVVKKTTRGYIRELKIILKNRITYIDNEIDDVEDFLKKLQKYLGKNVTERKVNEPIDYDHPIFYFFFGILLGFISFESVKLFLCLNAPIICILYYFVSLLSIIFGTYFIVYNPIYKRDGKSNKKADYIWGIIFIIGGILVLLTTAC